MAKSASGGCLATTKQLYPKKMFAFGNNEAARQATWGAVLADREAAREAVRNASTPTMEDLIRSISPVSAQNFGENVGDFSPPASGRASVDHTTVFNAATRAGLHLTESLEKIEELEGQLETARRQLQALRWSVGRRDNRLEESELLRKTHEKDLTRMVRELRRVHDVLPMALEMHRSKTRALHPEEEEEMLHHFLQRGNVVETYVEITGHGEGMVRVTSERDDIFFSPMRTTKRKRVNIFREDKKWRADHPWIRISMGVVHVVNYGRCMPMPQEFSKFLKRNLAGITRISLDNLHRDSLRELCRARGKIYSYRERLY